MKKLKQQAASTSPKATHLASTYAEIWIHFYPMACSMLLTTQTQPPLHSHSFFLPGPCSKAVYLIPVFYWFLIRVDIFLFLVYPQNSSFGSVICFYLPTALPILCHETGLYVSQKFREYRRPAGQRWLSLWPAWPQSKRHMSHGVFPITSGSI